MLISRVWAIASLTEIVTLDGGERLVLNRFLEEEAVLILVFEVNAYTLLRT